MTDPVTEPGPRSCPRTGRSRTLSPLPGTTRPSDVLTMFLATGVAWLVAAGVVAVVAAATGSMDARWLALHFAFVGGVSQLIVGAAQFFACAFLATSPPAQRTVRAELLLWNAATVAVAVGVPLKLVPLTGIGGTLLLAGLAVFAFSLRGMRRRSLQHRPWATRWYLTAAAFLAGGAVLGPVMAAETGWTYGSLLGAHLVLNLGGWFGTTIIGTLHTFYPSLAGTLLRRPRLQAPTFIAWTAGIVVLAVSAASDLQAGGALGWALLLAASLMLAVNLLGSALAATQRSPALLVVSAGQVLLIGALLVGLGSALRDGPLAALVGVQQSAPMLLYVAGWIGLTVAGSLLHLLPLMGRVRTLDRPVAGSPHMVVALSAVSAVVVGVLVTASGGPEFVDGAGRTLLVLGYLALALRIVPLAVQAVRAGPLRI